MSTKNCPGFVRFLMVTVGWIICSNSVLGAAPAQWLKIETDDFVVYSDAPEKQVIECTVRYVAFRRAFSEMFLPPGASLPPSNLILFRTAKAFQSKIPPTNAARVETLNYSAEIDGTSLNAFALAGDRDGALASTFEFETIWALRRLGYAVPIWMSQGAGEVLATLSISKGQCVIGHYGDNTYNESFAWPKFFEIDESSSIYRTPRQLSDFLGQAWGLMHWVLLNDTNGREHFISLAGRLRSSDALKAVTAEMAVDSDHFNKLISAHLSRKSFRAVSFDEAFEVSRLHVLPALDAEVFVQMSNLLGASGQSGPSDAELDRACKIAPDLPVVKEACARRMERDGRPDDALRLYREAFAKGSKNVAAYLFSANARLDDLRIGGRDMAGEGGIPAKLAADELRQAIRLSPARGEAYRMLGRALFVQPTITDVEVAELSPGITVGENGGAVRYYRAQLYARLGRMEESQADLRAIIGDPLLPAEMRQMAKSSYVSAVLQADAKRIQKLLAEKNYAAAKAVVQVANATFDDENVRRVYKRFGSLIDEQENADSAK